ncbi:hypothetical protein ElyMa_000149500 [Elysia marginata]|uniref:Uncharacterized protein n=1 Tax=Elysia marginata TaxID=1093978 RepID=A0AAV4ERL9_9GAST|nr:hypothetical protein ElyMa_000149500 [Elysia marginata]
MNCLDPRQQQQKLLVVGTERATDFQDIQRNLSKPPRRPLKINNGCSSDVQGGMPHRSLVVQSMLDFQFPGRRALAVPG